MIDIPTVESTALQFVGRVLAALVIVVAGQFATNLVVRSLRIGATQARVKPALIDLSAAATRGIALVIILSGALQALGLDQVALAIGGSVSLIALGISTAASGNLGDIIAGVFLASDPDFGTGFTISSGDLIGVIEHVDLRKTRLRTADGKLHIIPNKNIENNPWIVEARPAAAAPVQLFKGFHRPGQPGTHPGAESTSTPTPTSHPLPSTPPG